MIASTNPFEILAPPLAGLLAFFYDHVMANYGVAIILMTVTVMLILAPLTWKGTRSMLAMQRLQPELKKIQQQHKNDKAALNEAMMAFYKEHNINPLGGCLPLLLQMPVFFGLFRSIEGLTHKVKGKGVVPKFIPSNTKLAQDLHKANGTMKAFGIDLAKSASSHHASFWAALPYLLLVVGIIVTGWYQQRQLTANNPQAAQANPQAQIMQKVFPVFFGLITYRFPAGVAVYWLAQSVVRIVQQWAMYRWDPSLTAEVRQEIREVEERAGDIKGGGTKTAKPASPAASSGRKSFFARLAEAAAAQQQGKDQAPGSKGTAAKPPPGKPAPGKRPPAPGKPAPRKPSPPSSKAGPPPGDGTATGSTGGNGTKPGSQPSRSPSGRSASRKRGRRGR